MKTLCQLKKWTLMSMLFLGASLTAYAIAPFVGITRCVVTHVESTTAHLEVEARGADKLIIEVWRSDVRVSRTEWETVATSPDDEIIGYYDISNLFPNTEYRVVVIAEGFKDLTEQSNTDSKECSFTTTSQQEP